MKQTPYLLFLVPCFLFSCSTPANKFNWLEGKWVQTNNKANFHEEWTRVNDTLLKGRGFMLNGTDTFFSEKLALETAHGKTIYLVEMATGRIAEFKLTAQSETQLVFEMPENDFPSKISYNKKNENELVVVLTGKQSGIDMKEELEFKKSDER